MSEVIDVRFKTLWNAPVCLAIGNQRPCVVQGPEDAVHFLSLRWPCERGSSYRRAKEKCLAAIVHRISVEAARETFVTACVDARLTSKDGYKL